MSEIPNFDKLVTHKSLDGDKMFINDILNTPIIIIGFQVSSSKYRDKGSGMCVKVQFYVENDENKAHKVFFSGSTVLKDELEEAKETLEKQNLPLLFRATVKKVGNYYSLV